MDHIDNMDQLLTETLTKTREALHISEKKQKRFVHINAKTRHTGCGQRILLFELCILIGLVVFLCPVSIWAYSHAVEVMKDKIEDTDMDAAEMEELYHYLKEEEGFSDENIEMADPLCTNENGQTYGPVIWDPDLISVTSDQGDDGYVYREDFYYDEIYAKDFHTPEDALAWQKAWQEMYPNGYSIPVYESDGETLIGTFTFGKR